MDPELMQNLLSAIVLAVVGILAYSVRGLVNVGLLYLEGKVGAGKLEAAKETALMIVRTLQQSPVYENLDPSRKKEMGLSWLADYSEERGLPYDYAFLDKLLEEAVHVVKHSGASE